jgi:hypothetical protein
VVGRCGGGGYGRSGMMGVVGVVGVVEAAVSGEEGCGFYWGGRS